MKSTQRNLFTAGGGVNFSSRQASMLTGWWTPKIQTNQVNLTRPVGYGNRGTAEAGATVTNDAERGYVWRFNGSGRVLCGTYQPITYRYPANAASWSAWVKWNGNFGGATNNVIIASGNDAGATNTWLINLWTATGQLSAIQIAARFYTTYKFFNAPMLAGRWYHVAVACQGSKVYAYLDGVSLGSQDMVGVDFGGTANPLTLGGQTRDGYPYCFTGLADDFRCYDRYLSAGEIAALYIPATRWELYSPLHRPVRALPMAAVTRKYGPAAQIM